MVSQLRAKLAGWRAARKERKRDRLDEQTRKPKYDPDSKVPGGTA